MYKKRVESWRRHLDFMMIDALMLQLAFVVAYVSRHGLTNPYANRPYVVSVIIVAVMGLFWSIAAESHKGIMGRGMLLELRSVIPLAACVTLSVLSYLYFTKASHLYSRLVTAFLFFYSIVFLWAGRQLWKTVLSHIAIPETSIRRMLVITNGAFAQQAMTGILENCSKEIEIIGLILTDDAMPVETEVCGVRVLTSMSQLLDYVHQLWVDEIMICLPRGEAVDEEIMEEFTIMGLTTHVMLDFRGHSAAMRRVEKIAGFTVLTESMRMASDWELTLKRLLDIAGGLVGCLITGILMVFVAPSIYFADPGPIFFTQIRVGRNGRTFKLYKFRSMYQDAEERKAELMARNNIADGMMFKMDDDPRILGSGPDGKKHGIGWLIRTFSIDEFPQFFNALKGDLSLVGTRPPTLEEWEKYEAHHRARLAFKPGITGLWQVSGRSSITEFEDVVALDLEYINNWSIWEDIRILFKTVQVVLTGEGAK